jgi:hypothetical protein
LPHSKEARSLAAYQTRRPPIHQGLKRHNPADRQDETEALRTIASELRAINQRQTADEQQRANNQSSYWDKAFAPENWSQWLLAVFAALAAGIAAKSLCAIEVQAIETRKAANAARRSASIAERSLRLLNQPWLDTADWDVSEEHAAPVPDGNGGFTQELTGLTVAFNVVNNSHTPATLYRIVMTDYGSGSPPTDYTVTAVVGNPITPGSKHPYQVRITDLAKSQIKSYADRTGFPVKIEGTIHFGDLFNTKAPNDDDSIDGPRKRRFGRQCLLRRGGRSEFFPIAGAESVEPQLGQQEQSENES